MSTTHRFVPAGDGQVVPGIDPSHTQAIKRWVVEHLSLSEADTVVVAESPCQDANCPVVETQIAVFAQSGGVQRWRMQRPKVAVTKTMVFQVLATPAQKS